MKPLYLFALTVAFAVVTSPAGAGDNSEVLQVTNLAGVNTKADEDDPFLTADGQHLIYASNESGTFDLMAAKRLSAGKFAPPRPLVDFNTKGADERSPFLTREGRFFFASNKVPDEKFKDLKNFDLWETMGGRAPTPLLQVCTAQDELFPWVTPNGKEFYFSRKTKEGWRVFVSRGPAFGGIGEGKLIEELPAGFHHATLSSSGLMMYLQGPLEKGRWGLFRSTRPKLGAAWAKPEPLTDLNSTAGRRGDISPCLSFDGTTLFFASDRPGGQGGLDLWSVPTAKLKTKAR